MDGHESEEALQAAFQAEESFRALGDRRMEESGKEKSNDRRFSRGSQGSSVSFCISAGNPGMKTSS